LAGRRWSLFLALLALNAFALPYAGFIHDARLYGVQVLNRVDDGAFADDLFFRYGSQDNYSAFSILVAPLTRWLGLEWTFFLLYLASNALLLLAMQRLVETLIPDRLASTLALVYLAVTSLPFGGLEIFHINENFLTPRIVANACTLLGLEQVLRGRFKTAVSLILLGCLMHPLMAFGGLLVAFVCWAVESLPRRAAVFLAVLLGTVAVVVLACPPVAYRLFGHMDEAWLQRVRTASAYNFPLDWTAADWLQAVVSIGVAVAGALALRHEEPRQARFLALLSLVAAGGLLGTFVASEHGYTILFQGQPYRALWLVKFLQPGLCLWLAGRLWRRAREADQVLAVLLTGYLGLVHFLPLEAGCIAGCAFFLALASRLVPEAARPPGLFVRSLARGTVLGLLAWTGIKLLAIACVWGRLVCLLDGLDLGRLLLSSPGPAGWLALAGVAVLALARTGFGVGFSAAALAACLAMHGTFFLVERTESYREHQRYGADVQFIREFLNSRYTKDQGPATVYWSTGRIDLLWLRARAKSYFTILQIQGILFSPLTAAEGERRALVVGRFEVEHMGRDSLVLSQQWLEQMRRLFRLDPNDAEPPTRADLEALCREEAVDYAVLPHAFDNLYVASNGRFFIYDCQQLRTRFTAPSADTPVASNTTRTSSP
jgi:hypothetical protein